MRITLANTDLIMPLMSDDEDEFIDNKDYLLRTETQSKNDLRTNKKKKGGNDVTNSEQAKGKSASSTPFRNKKN